MVTRSVLPAEAGEPLAVQARQQNASFFVPQETAFHEWYRGARTGAHPENR